MHRLPDGGPARGAAMTLVGISQAVANVSTCSVPGANGAGGDFMKLTESAIAPFQSSR